MIEGNQKAYLRKYYLANKDKYAQRQREHRRLNPKKVAATERQWKQANPDKVVIATKKWRAKNQDKVVSMARKSQLKKYGLTQDQFDALLKSQNGLCKICLQPETRKTKGVLWPLSVDHCHKTGRVRGLLCAACNSALGLLQEDRLRINSMLRYLD